MPTDYFLPYTTDASSGGGSAGITLVNAANFTDVRPVSATFSALVSAPQHHNAGELSGSTFSNYRPHSEVYAQNGHWFRFGLRSGDSQTPVQMSSENAATATGLCGDAALIDTDFTNPNAAFLLYQLAGADGSCNTADDVFKVFQLSAGASTAPRTVAGLVSNNLSPFYNGSGQLLSVLASDAGGNLVLYDASLQNPRVIFSGTGGNTVDGDFDVYLSHANGDAYVRVKLKNGTSNGQGALILQISSAGTVTQRLRLPAGCDFTSSASDSGALYLLEDQDFTASAQCSSSGAVPVLLRLPLASGAATTMLTAAAFTGGTGAIAGVTQNKVVFTSGALVSGSLLETVAKTASNASAGSTIDSTGVGGSITVSATAGSRIYYSTAVVDTTSGNLTYTAKVKDESGTLVRSFTAPSQFTGFAVSATFSLGGGSFGNSYTNLLLQTGGTFSGMPDINGATLSNYDIAADTATPLVTLSESASFATIFSFGPIGLGVILDNSPSQSDVFVVNFAGSGYRRITSTTTSSEEPN